jgi:hypothetical protein
MSVWKKAATLFMDMTCEGLVLFDGNNFLENLIDEAQSYLSEMNMKKLSDGWLFPVDAKMPLFSFPGFKSK